MSKEELDRLKAENQKLRKALEHEKKDHEKIKQEKERLEKEKEHIEKEFEEFKAKHALTVSKLQKALKIKPDKRKKRKKAGAKQGHKGHWRIIPERIDYIKPWIPKRCPHCESKLEGDTQEIRERYVTDIKLTAKAKTTRYDIHRLYCKKCKKLVEKPVSNALPRAKYGLNLMLLIMYLRLGLRLPGNKTSEFLLTMYNIHIGEGEIVCILKQLQKAFGQYYKHLKKLVRVASVKYTDATSWRVNGNSYHALVFVAVGVVLYKVSKKYNSNRMLDVFGKKQKGKTLVVDRHSANRALAEKAGFLLQLCWSHITDDSKGLAKSFGKDGKYVHKKLKEIYALATGLEHKGTKEQVEQLKGEIFALTQRSYRSTTVRKFVNNLWRRDIDNLFRFVTNPDVDPTNNISERELRALVIIRKISNGSRSRRGANITAELLSIIQTVRMKKTNILLGLQEILANPSFH